MPNSCCSARTEKHICAVEPAITDFMNPVGCLTRNVSTSIQDVKNKRFTALQTLRGFFRAIAPVNELFKFRIHDEKHTLRIVRRQDHLYNMCGTAQSPERE